MDDNEPAQINYLHSPKLKSPRTSARRTLLDGPPAVRGLGAPAGQVPLRRLGQDGLSGRRGRGCNLRWPTAAPGSRERQQTTVGHGLEPRRSRAGKEQDQGHASAGDRTEAGRPEARACRAQARRLG